MYNENIFEVFAFAACSVMIILITIMQLIGEAQEGKNLICIIVNVH